MDDTEVMGLEGLGPWLREYVWLSIRRRGASCPTIATGALVRASLFCTAARRVSPVHVKPWSRSRGAMPRRMGGVDPRQLVTAHPSGKEKAPRGDVALSG